MIILAIDTADKITGAAVIRDGEILGERNLLLGKKRDQALSAMVKGLLEDCGVNMGVLEGVAVSAGPGSFTGLRVGAAYVKGLCFAADIPLATVGSLEALAHTFRFSSRLIIPVIHARGDEVYHSAFRVADEVIAQVWEARLENFRELASRIKEPVLLAGSGYANHASEFESALPGLVDSFSVLHPVPTVRAVAEIGEKKIIRRETADIRSFEPKYLQDFPRSI